MRLWHKDLIPLLPRQQFIAQYRELCGIAKNWDINGTPNHILVNKVMDYSVNHLYTYATLVKDEIKRRDYVINNVSWHNFYEHCLSIKSQETTESRDLNSIPYAELYSRWHTDRYLKQCLYNLQEKYDCGGMSQQEWDIIKNYYSLNIKGILL